MTEAEPEAMSVTELTDQIKDCLEGNFPAVLVQGEISNLSRASSGHLYLTLKDDTAQMRAVVWRTAASRIRFDQHDRLEVLAAGRVEVYPARGSYQLVIEALLPRGLGALELAFRQLHERLSKEGLFAPERKRPLPRFPRRIALVTSPTGAAVRDMLQVLTRRWPGVQIVILPVPVQGVGAGERIAAALRSVSQIPDLDVVICGRGGGSLEDLWAFNEEVVARAIYHCAVPVVSAVGHEIDVTIADFVADRRALTPSEAAELVVPQIDELNAWLNQAQQRMIAALRHQASAARKVLDQLAASRVFRLPFDRVQLKEQQLDDLQRELVSAMRRRIERSQQQLQQKTAQLAALSPLNVLERGYSVTRPYRKEAILSDLTATLPDSPRPTVIRSIHDVRPGESIETLLLDGRLISTVDTVQAEDRLVGTSSSE